MNMFGALNRFISRLDDGPPTSSQGPNKGAFGFQVLRNKNSDIPLEPWYDFIVGINGRSIDNPDPSLFAQEVRNCAGSAVSLILWSAKGQKFRTISLPIPSPAPTLGITLQWSPLTSTNDVWHILDVIPNSPADLAGLLPYGDYIVGTPEGLVRGEPGLGELVEDYLQRPLRLWVYNHEYGVTRLVTMTPSRSWGGEGALGCVLGYGALHLLPQALEEPSHEPGDTLFETGRFSNEEGGNRQASPERAAYGTRPSDYSSPSLMVPAAMAAAPPLSAPGSGPPRASPGPGRGARRGRGANSPNAAFDEMWEEGATKSKEEDYTPKSKSPAPPPPKATGSSAEGEGLKPPEEGEEERQTRSPDPILDEDDA